MYIIKAKRRQCLYVNNRTEPTINSMPEFYTTNVSFFCCLPETITKNKPILLIEIEKRHSKRPVEESIATISNLKYECFFVKDNELIPVEKLNNKNLENNFFFLPK